MKPKYFAVQQAGREADIYIFGDIVAERWYEEETSAFSLKEAVKGLDVDVINVYIDSYGGYVSEGWAIYNELRNHPAKVRTFGTGFVASAALYPFMAGDERYAMDPSAYFFHQMLSGASGNADDFRKAADELEKLNAIGRAAFTENTNLTAEDVLELERKETWLSPYEALQLGIATAVINSAPPSIPMQSIKKSVIHQMLIGGNASPMHGCDQIQSGVVWMGHPSFEPVEGPEPEETNVNQPAGIMQLLGKIFEL